MSADSDFEVLVRKALREAKWWDELTAPDETAREVLDLLRQWRQRVLADIKNGGLKVAETDFARAAGEITHQEATTRKREYVTWKRKATGFANVLDERIGELETRFAEQSRRTSSQRDLQMRQQHASKRAQYRGMLRLLAAAIYLHQSEEITDADLYSLLDDLSIPVNDFGSHEYYDVTLRQAAEQGKLVDVLEEVRARAGTSRDD